jgi:hypothetical protein
LQEPESRGIVGSGTDRLPLAAVRVGLINGAQLRHGLSELGKAGSDPAGDKPDHTVAVPSATMHPICQSSPESDSESDGEVHMVGNGEEFLDKSVKGIQCEIDKELTRTAHLVKEAERGKRHNSQQYDSGTSEDEPRDGAPARRHHPKFNS